MGAPSHAVVWFEDVGHGDVAVAGGKGANLGELVAAGVPVPPGFIVTTAAYRAFLDDTALHPRLEAVLEGLDVSDRGALERASARARALITDHESTPACAGDIAAAYERLGGGLVAVRSSATAEDTDAASFAGQQSTYLNIEGPGRVVDAVRACWASLFEPQALHYRAQCGIGLLDDAIAVPVQRMVQATRSGVAFSCDPITHSTGEVVINAVLGLGEALVSGQVTPDSYVVHKATMTVLERTVVDQPRQLAYAGGDGLHPNAWRDVPPVSRTRQKLADDEIVRLAEAVCRVEAHYGTPQDIEWAEAEGAFYILQSRPVTTLDHTHAH